MKPLTTTQNLVLACSLALLTACGGGSSSITTDADVNDDMSSLTDVADNAVDNSDAGDITDLTDGEIETLLFVREEEKLARDVYLTLYDKWGVNVFENIATRSEQQHMDIMGDMISTYNLVDPVQDDTVGAFTDPAILGLYQDLVMRGSNTQLDGLKVGGFIEEFDINDLQEAIVEAKAGSNPTDIITAYENLMCGSRNHLRAFVRQIEKTEAYVAQVISQDEVDAIVSTPEEQCGQ